MDPPQGIVIANWGEGGGKTPSPMIAATTKWHGKPQSQPAACSLQFAGAAQQGKKENRDEKNKLWKISESRESRE